MRICEDCTDPEHVLKLEGKYDPSQDYGFITVSNAELIIEDDSIKMYYQNGQTGNKQEVYRIDNKSSNSKLYEFNLKSIERNILQNDFLLSMKCSSSSHPDSYIENIKIKVSFYFNLNVRPKT